MNVIGCHGYQVNWCHCVRTFLLIFKNVFFQQELTKMFQLRDTNECDRLPWLPSQLVSLCEDIPSDIHRQACVISFFR